MIAPNFKVLMRTFLDYVFVFRPVSTIRPNGCISVNIIRCLTYFIAINWHKEIMIAKEEFALTTLHLGRSSTRGKIK